MRTKPTGRRTPSELLRLLHDALAKADRVGIGRWVFHNREYLVAIRALPDALALHTMRFAAELVDAATLKLKAPSKKPTQRGIDMAGTLVESLHDDFDPAQFQDGYRDRVLALVHAKARGEEPELPEPEQSEPDTDLMATLEASLNAGRR